MAWESPVIRVERFINRLLVFSGYSWHTHEVGYKNSTDIELNKEEVVMIKEGIVLIIQ